MKSEVMAAADAAVESRRKALAEAELAHRVQAEKLASRDVEVVRLQGRHVALDARIADLQKRVTASSDKLLEDIAEGTTDPKAAAAHAALEAELRLTARALEFLVLGKMRRGQRDWLCVHVEERITAAEACRAELDLQKSIVGRAALDLAGVEQTLNITVAGGRSDELVARLAISRREAADALKALDEHDADTRSLEGNHGP